MVDILVRDEASDAYFNRTHGFSVDDAETVIAAIERETNRTVYQELRARHGHVSQVNKERKDFQQFVEAVYAVARHVHWITERLRPEEKMAIEEVAGSGWDDAEQ